MHMFHITIMQWAKLFPCGSGQQSVPSISYSHPYPPAILLAGLFHIMHYRKWKGIEEYSVNGRSMAQSFMASIGKALGMAQVL